MIYFLRNPRNDFIKVGWTVSLEQRIAAHVIQHGTLVILGLMEGERDTEQQIHKAFRDMRARVKDEVEWYKPCDELMCYIANNADFPVSAQLHASAARPRRPSREAMSIAISARQDQDGHTYTYHEVAALINMSPGIVWRIMGGNLSDVSSYNLRRFCNWLGCTIDDLLPLPDAGERETA